MKKTLNYIIKYSLYLLVFLLPLFFLPFPLEAFEFNKQYLLFFLVSLSFLAWLAKMILIDKEVRFKRSPLDIFVLIFLFIAILSALSSVDKGSSLFGFYGRFSDGLIGLLCLGIFYFLITNNVGIKTKPQNKEIKSIDQDSEVEDKPSLISQASLVKVFLWSISFVILLSYFTIFGLWQRLNQLVSLPLVMQRVIFNPVAGSMEGLAIFLAVIVVFLTGISLKNNKQVGEKSKKVLLFVLLLASLGLLMIIGFNPAWLIVFLALFLFLFFALWKRMFKEEINKLLLPILLVVLSFTFIFINTSAIFQGTVLRHYIPQEQILGQQVSWSIGLNSATDDIRSGLLGSGIGTFHYGFSRFKPVEINQTDFWQVRFDRSGNYPAEVLGTMGFLGLFSYLALLGMFLLISYLFWQKNKSGIVFLMVFLALLVSQFVFYQNMVLAFLFWLFLALSVVTWQKPSKEKVISFKDFPEISLVFSVLLVLLILASAGMYFFAARFYLADVNYKNYFQAGEEERIERAVELNPYQSQYKIVLARHYLDKIISEGQKPIGQIDEASFSDNIYLAIASAKEATELSPNRVLAWEMLGTIYREIQGVASGATEWTARSFKTAAVLEPVSPIFPTELGKLYFLSGEMDLAEEKFSQAKELMPSYFDAIFQLGRLYLNTDRTDEAISQFKRAINIFPNHSDSLYSLGVAYQRKGEKEEAILAFERVLELNPGNQDVIRKLEELRKAEDLEEEEIEEPEEAEETE